MNRKRENKTAFPSELLLQISLVLIFVLIFFLFYPPIYSIFDEAIYFAMAHVLNEGVLFPEEAGYYVPGTVDGVEHRISHLPLGWPLLLSPLLQFGWNAFFLLPLALHLIGYFYFRKILSDMEIDPAYSFLYLLYPTFVFHSRTLMTDLPAAVFFLIGFYYSIQKEKSALLFAGICFGISLWIRHSSILIATTMIAILFFRDWKRKNTVKDYKVIPLLYGFIPFVMSWAAYNYLTFGNPFFTGYDKADIGVRSSFALSHFVNYFPKYFLFLNLIYPFMGISLLFYKGVRRLEICSCVLVILLFYSFYYWFDSGSNFIQTAIKSLRFFLPIIPLMLLCYLKCLDTYIFSRLTSSKKWGFATLCAVFLTMLAFGIQYGHQKYLQRQKHFSDLIYQNTVENSSIIANMEIIEMLQTAWGKRKIIEYDLAAITQATNESDSNVYFITNIKAERPGLRAQNVLFLAELQKRYYVSTISKFQDQGWELSIYRVSRSQTLARIPSSHRRERGVRSENIIFSLRSPRTLRLKIV